VIEIWEHGLADGDEVAGAGESLGVFRGTSGTEGRRGEVAAVADVGDRDIVDVDGRKVRHKVACGDEGFEGAVFGGERGELLEGAGMADFEFGAGEAAERVDMRAAAEGFAEVVRDGTDVG